MCDFTALKKVMNKGFEAVAQILLPVRSMEYTIFMRQVAALSFAIYFTRARPSLLQFGLIELHHDRRKLTPVEYRDLRMFSTNEITISLTTKGRAIINALNNTTKLLEETT